MGAGCSSLLARRSSRRSLCPWFRPWLRPGGRDTKDRQDGGSASGPGNALGVVVMSLQNPPDVIEAHQRYYSHGMGPATPAARAHAVPVKYSYFSASAADAAVDAVRPRTTVRPRRALLDTSGLHAAAKDHADVPRDLLRDRTLPTQHQHPVPGSPRYPRRWTASATASDRPRCRRQAHADRGHSARPRPSRTPRCGGRSSRTCRSSRTRSGQHNASRPGPPCSRGIFGYDIQDVDSFLAKASLEKPANIPMVLACPSTLYRTEEGGWQQEVPLPLGMVVNGVFRVESTSPSSCWLYAQTPHGHEGYVRYASCLPLGILATPAAAKTASTASATTLARSASPSPSSATSSEILVSTRRHRVVQPLPTPASGRGRSVGPSWDTASDIFPATLASLASLAGNQTDTDKAKDTRSERGFNCARGSRTSRADRGLQLQQGLLEVRRAERSVDELFLRSIRSGSTPSYAGGSMYFSSSVNVC